MGRRKADPIERLHEDCLKYAQCHLFKEPRVRKDVAQRKSSNRQTSVSVVKTTWNSFCKPAAMALPIEDVLREINKTVTEAYILANLHVVRMCELQDQLTELDQTFFYGCLSAVSQAGRKKALISDVRFRESVEVYHSWREACQGYQPPDSHHLSSGWHQNISLQMATNAKNSTSLNFSRRFKRYLKHKYQLEGKQAWQALVNISASAYDGDDPIVLSYRQIMPAKPAYGWAQDHPHLVMPLQYIILKYFEGAQLTDEKNKQLRLFTLLPMKHGFECCHVKMCTNGLHGLLKRAGVDVPSQATDWRHISDAHWRNLFNIDKFETVNRKFAGEILTDGKAVSIVMRKPKQVEGKKKDVHLEDYDEVWGLDPGRTAMFTSCNEDGVFQSCTTREFYDAAQYKQSNRTIKGWQDRDLFVKQAIKLMPSKKTSSLSSLKTYVEFLLPKLDRLLRFHMQKGFRKLKLRRYIFAKKKLRDLCLTLTARAGKKTLVGFGDWSNRDSAGIIKKSPAGPVKRFEQELRKHCKVVAVDEFRTSKLHHGCNHVLHHQYSHKMINKKTTRDVKTQRIHSVLFCKNRSCNGMAMDRDENASRNILEILKQSLRDGTRPRAFCRGTELSTGDEMCIGAPSREASVCPETPGLLP